jgi:hypothetical protein
LADLNELDIGGLGQINMAQLSTTELTIDMSGAGEFQLDELTAERVDISMGGLGTIDITGQVDHVELDISGAGDVRLGDLQSATADVGISGLGNATVWVTDSLTGNISGGGRVSYYGNPSTDTDTTGLGEFQSLGDK